MTSTKQISTARLKHELTVLKQRVSWLEKALRPKEARTALRDGNADLTRKQAERDAHHKAMKDYLDEKRRKMYEESPNMLRADRKWERERNAYLRERGLKPLPSDIPKGLSRAKR